MNNNKWIIIFMNGPENAYKIVHGTWKQADMVGENIGRSYNYLYRIEDYSKLSNSQKIDYHKRLVEL